PSNPRGPELPAPVATTPTARAQSHHAPSTDPAKPPALPRQEQRARPPREQPAPPRPPSEHVVVADRVHVAASEQHEPDAPRPRAPDRIFPELQPSPMETPEPDVHV